MSLQVVILRSLCTLVNRHRLASPTPGSSMPMTSIYQSAHSCTPTTGTTLWSKLYLHWPIVSQGQQCWRYPVWSTSGIFIWHRFTILSHAHLHQDRSSCQSCTYEGHADFGIPWVGTLWDTLFPSWRLPVSSEAQGMDCWDACSMGWLVPGGSNHHVSLLLLPKRQPWVSAWLWQDGAKEAVLWFGSIGQWIHEIVLFCHLITSNFGTYTVLYYQWIHLITVGYFFSVSLVIMFYRLLSYILDVCDQYYWCLGCNEYLNEVILSDYVVRVSSAPQSNMSNMFMKSLLDLLAHGSSYCHNNYPSIPTLIGYPRR